MQAVRLANDEFEILTELGEELRLIVMQKRSYTHWTQKAEIEVFSGNPETLLEHISWTSDQGTPPLVCSAFSSHRVHFQCRAYDGPCGIDRPDLDCIITKGRKTDDTIEIAVQMNDGHVMGADKFDLDIIVDITSRFVGAAPKDGE